MRLFRALSACTFAGVLVGLASALPNDFRGNAASNSSDDSFYLPPAGFESTAPGTILRSRKVPHPIGVGEVEFPVEGAWQLLYRTQDSLGKPEATMLTVLKPKNAKSTNLFSESYFVVSLHLLNSPAEYC
jgi:hypothetical protein